jgi:hypothetical protein
VALSLARQAAKDKDFELMRQQLKQVKGSTQCTNGKDGESIEGGPCWQMAELLELETVFPKGSPEAVPAYAVARAQELLAKGERFMCWEDCPSLPERVIPLLWQRLNEACPPGRDWADFTLEALGPKPDARILMLLAAGLMNTHNATLAERVLQKLWEIHGLSAYEPIDANISPGTNYGWAALEGLQAVQSALGKEEFAVRTAALRESKRAAAEKVSKADGSDLKRSQTWKDFLAWDLNIRSRKDEMALQSPLYCFEIPQSK